MYSVKRRIVIIVLCSELVLTGAATAVALLYERAQLFTSFDVALQGKADSVMAAVQEAGDESDNIRLDTHSLQIPPADLFDVREPNGHLLGRSANWPTLPEKVVSGQDGLRDFRSEGRRFHGLLMHGVRTVDPNEQGAGMPRPVVVFYAAPIHAVTKALQREAKYLAVVNFLVLTLTGAVVLLLLRKGLAPLGGLATAAAGVSTRSWSFEPPAAARNAAELRPLIDALETALRGLELSFVQQSTFVNDAAHELKTAVTIVKSSLQLLMLKERTAAEYRSGLELCLSDCGRMEELVVKMLMLARFEQRGGKELAQIERTQTVTTDFTLCVHQVIEQLAPTAKLGNIHLQLDAVESAFVEIPAEECIILVTNLLLNAIQHSPAQTMITLQVTHGPPGQLLFSVQDQGSGIAAEHLPFIFQRFYRGDPSRSRNSGGTGLGLAICHAITEAHGGTIEIASQLGKGTRVRAFLLMQ